MWQVVCQFNFSCYVDSVGDSDSECCFESNECKVNVRDDDAQDVRARMRLGLRLRLLPSREHNANVVVSIHCSLPPPLLLLPLPAWMTLCFSFNIILQQFCWQTRRIRAAGGDKRDMWLT